MTNFQASVPGNWSDQGTSPYSSIVKTLTLLPCPDIHPKDQSSQPGSPGPPERA